MTVAIARKHGSIDVIVKTNRKDSQKKQRFFHVARHPWDNTYK